MIRVNRSPMTREWTADNATGSTKANQAIWVESADSVGFSMGFTCTAMIDEADAARFLYWYPTGSLEKVMDTEIRARIQQNAAEVAARYPLDSLRTKKQEMIDAVRADVFPFFKTRGITVTTVSMFGGMTYENPEIQKANRQDLHRAAGKGRQPGAHSKRSRRKTTASSWKRKRRPRTRTRKRKVAATRR